MGPNARTSRQQAAALRNLSHRLAKPSLGRGRIQRQCRRALWALGTASTSDAIAWSYREVMWGERSRHFNRAAIRALTSIGAVRVGRAKTIGRPWLWRLKDS